MPRPTVLFMATATCITAMMTLAGSQDRPSTAARFEPGRRVLLDAHNAYPEQGRWEDRIDRALATGTPVAIEQDLVWHCPSAGRCRSIVSHGEPFTGAEPTLETYFFRRIEPLVRQALVEGASTEHWPLVTLNLDLKTTERGHLLEIWRLLGRYERWLTTAERQADGSAAAPLVPGPLLVLTGDQADQQIVFHDEVPVGGRLRVFGAVQVAGEPKAEHGDSRADVARPPRAVAPGPRTNYRRWWNSDWTPIEGGGQRHAGPWTPEDAHRLRDLVRRAHAGGLWLRIYTLNGHTPAESRGWNPAYNFGSADAVALRWRAAIEAGVDFVATDQYEAFAARLAGARVGFDCAIADWRASARLWTCRSPSS